MIHITHRFLDHRIHPNTEVLLIGTFNPETERNPAEFFYGRRQNFLWRLLPIARGEKDLKECSPAEKLAFMHRHRIDFTDLIEELCVESGQEANYDDTYLDSKVSRWKDIIGLIDSLPYLKKVAFTRKTFAGIPNMKQRILEIQWHCESKGLDFKALTTPSRFYSTVKQSEWTGFLKMERQ